MHELYDLEKDLGEKENLAKSMPAMVKKLDLQLLTLLQEDGARLPKKNPSFP